MNEDRGARYQRLRRRTTLAGAAWSFGLPAVLVLSRAHVRLGTACLGWIEAWNAPLWAAPWLAAAVYGGCLAAAHEAILIPLFFRGHFLLDRRYGLATQPPAAWLAARVAGAALLVLAAAVAAAGLCASIRWWPHGWWLAAWMVAVAASAVVAWQGPRWVLARRGTQVPLETPRLADRLDALARRAGVRPLPIVVWRGGGGERQPRAMLAGTGTASRIVLSERLVADYSDDEIEVVVAHELAHHLRRDMTRTLAVDGVLAGCALFVASLVLHYWHARLGLQLPYEPAALAVLAAVVVAASGLLRPAATAASRAVERRTDRLALALTGSPAAFTSAVRRLAASHLADEHPPTWVRWWFCSHPPVSERLTLARDWAPAPDGRATGAASP